MGISKSDWWLHIKILQAELYSRYKDNSFTCILYEKGECWRWVKRAKTLLRGVKSKPLDMFTSLRIQTVIKRFFSWLATLTSADTTRTLSNPNYKQTDTHKFAISITHLHNFFYLIVIGVFLLCSI